MNFGVKQEHGELAGGRTCMHPMHGMAWQWLNRQAAKVDGRAVNAAQRSAAEDSMPLAW